MDSEPDEKKSPQKPGSIAAEDAGSSSSSGRSEFVSRVKSSPQKSSGIVAEDAGSSSGRGERPKDTAKASSSAAKLSSITHRPRNQDHMSEASSVVPDNKASNAIAGFDLPSPLKKQGARLRSLWAAIRAKRPVHLIKRHATQAAQEIFQIVKEFLEKLPNEAKIAMLALLALCKLLFLLFIFGAGCNCRKKEQQSATSALATSAGPYSANLSAYDSLAVCLSGDPRYLPFTGSSLLRHVIEPFPSAHVFVSAHMNEHAHRLAVFARLAPRKEGSWQLVSVRMWPAPGVTNRVWGSMQPHMRRERETISMVSRWWLVEDSFRMLKEQEKKYSIKYKWVVQASLDQFWAEPVPAAAFALTHEVAVPFTSTQGGLNDAASVCQRRAAQRFMPRLEGLVRAQLQSGGAPADDLRPAAVLFRLGLAQNMLQHVGFVSLPFCRLTPSAASSAILAVGSAGAADGYPCHPCRDVVRGQPGWALATRPSPDGVPTDAIPTVLASEVDRLGVCYGKLARFDSRLYQEWNAALASGKLLGFGTDAADNATADGPRLSKSPPAALPPPVVAVARQLYSGAQEWQVEPQDYAGCVQDVKRLAARGALAALGPRGLASVQGGATPESVCTRWLMGPVQRAGVLDWPVFTSFLTKESVVYQFGVGNNIAFIKGITRVFGCHVHGFDETPRSIQWMKSQRLPMRFHHVPYMLGPKEGTLLYVEERDGSPTFLASAAEAGAANGKKVNGKSLKSILTMMKHPKIDVAVIDMRGADSAIISSWSLGSGGPQMCQLLVRHYDTSPSSALKEEVPWQHLSDLGFVLASSTPVARGHLHLFFHPDVCIDPAKKMSH